MIFETKITNYITKGINEVVFEIDYFQRNYVYEILSGEDVTESLLNCLSYDTELSGIYLKGNFAVFSKESFGKASSNVYYSNLFYAI